MKKHHRPPSSITKGLKNLVLDPAIAQPQSPSSRRPEPQASYSSLTSSWTSPGKGKSTAVARTDSIDSDWDIVSDLPLRWATHFTPLASAGSRLQNNPVLFYDIWRNEAQRVRGGALLAVATKSSILLYEAPKGERAFRLAKVCIIPFHIRVTMLIPCRRNFTRPSQPEALPLSTSPCRTTWHEVLRTSSRGPPP